MDQYKVSLKKYTDAISRVINYDRQQLKASIKRNKFPINQNQTTHEMKKQLLNYLEKRFRPKIPLAKSIEPVYVLPSDEEINKIIEDITQEYIVRPGQEFRLLPHDIAMPIMENMNDQVKIEGDNIIWRINSPMSEDTIKDHINKHLVKNRKYKFLFKLFDIEGRFQIVNPQNGINYSPKNVNDFYYGVIAKFYQPTYKWLQVYPQNAEPQDFTLFNSTTNCVIDSIKQRLPKHSAKLDQYAVKNNFDGTKPMTKVEANKLAKAFKIYLVFHSQVGIWYECGYAKGAKVNIFAHNDHASVYIPITKINQPIITWNIQEEIQKVHQTLKIKMNVQRNQHGNIEYHLESFRAGDKIYKSYPTPEPENPEYYHCTSEISYEFAKFVKVNNLRPLTNEYYDITKSADHHLTTQQFQPITDQKYHNYDMNKAFPTFKCSKYYQKYKLALGYVQLYNNTDLEYIDRPGFSRVSNIVYKNEIIESTKWIQENTWYTHIRLNYILENNLAEFEITQTIIAQSEDIEFPFKPFDNVPEHKRFNNTFIGMLIAGGHDETKQDYYTTNSPNELEQLRYELNLNPNTVAVAPIAGNLILHEYRSTQRALFHIHAQIIDYQQVTFMSELCKVNKQDLVAFFTDGFYTTKPQNIISSTNPHEFKYSNSQIKGTSTYEPTIHAQSNHVNAPSINMHKTRLNSLNATIGPPGCGKTFIAIESHPRVCRVVLAPNHKLKASLKEKVTALSPNTHVSTYHKFFGIGVKYHVQQVVEQIDIDEITMCPDEHLNHMINICKQYRMCLSIFGDFDASGHIFQRPPTSKAGIPLTVETINKFTISQEISPIRRQNNIDATFLDSLRSCAYDEIVTMLKQKCPVIRSDETDPTIIGVSSMHVNCNQLNKRVYETIKQYRPWLRCRCVKKNSQHHKGQTTYMPEANVWLDRTSSTQTSEFSYEIAYFNTIDAVQGDTIDAKYYIDLRGSHMENALYTAVTRCRNLSDVILIE